MGFVIYEQNPSDFGAVRIRELAETWHAVARRLLFHGRLRPSTPSRALIAGVALIARARRFATRAGCLAPSHGTKLGGSWPTEFQPHDAGGVKHDHLRVRRCVPAEGAAHGLAVAGHDPTPVLLICGRLCWSRARSKGRGAPAWGFYRLEQLQTVSCCCCSPTLRGGSCSKPVGSPAAPGAKILLLATACSACAPRQGVCGHS